jgi:hypothetical protein
VGFNYYCRYQLLLSIITTMNRILTTLSLVLCVGFCKAQNTSSTAAFSQKQGPLMTRWDSQINPANPLPEYPRPQLVRASWLNLNGLWEFQSGAAGDAVPAGKKLNDQILVPYPVEAPISGVMKHYDRLWYRRSFTVPAAWKGKNVVINFGAVDWESEVFINGRSLGVHKGGYDAFSYDITPYLVKGKQEIIVRVFDPTEDYGQPRGKQTTHPIGIMYTPVTGIWQSVWLEPVSKISISGLTLIPDVDGKRLKVTVNTSSAAKGLTVLVKAKDGATTVATTQGKANTAFYVPISKAKLWSPDAPFLYDLTVTLKNGATVVDNVGSYFGMRKISIADDGGYKKMFLNNQFLYEMGVLDQGFWPDGIYTAPTDEALKNDIVQAKAVGLNLIRKHIKVEPQRWYYWADKLGILVWQDMPSTNSYLPREVTPPAVDKQQFQSELTRMINGHINSPAIIMWVLFNESQGQHDTEELVKYIQQTDPSRLVNEASGDKLFGKGDVIDRHSYPEPAMFDSKTQAMVVGEFGGIGHNVKDHMWGQKGAGYTDVVTPQDLVFLYADHVGMIKDFVQHKGLSASIYTQLTDVETENNGLMTYDRILKAKAADLKLINTFKYPDPVFKTVIANAEKEAQPWKYTTTKPADNWAEQTFSDAAWTDGKAGFGKVATYGNTDWATPDIWMRKTFDVGNLTEAEISSIGLRGLFDGTVAVFINGVRAYQENHSKNNYTNRGITQEARKAIKPNSKNVIAIHVTARKGHQYIDAGLYVRTSAVK